MIFDIYHFFVSLPFWPVVLLELYPIFRLSLQTQNPCHSQHEDGYALLVSIEQYFLDY